MLLRHLAQAERHVALGAEHIRRQDTLIEETRRDGHAIQQAEQLLVEFEDLQARHVAHRDRLTAELTRMKQFGEAIAAAGT